MRTIIAGGRNMTNFTAFEYAMKAVPWVPSIIISGAARGIDTLGEMYAADHNIPVERFPALWDEHGRSAGYRRNVQMGNNADALIAVWDGVSKGTEHMMNIAHSEKLIVINIYKHYKLIG